MSNRAGFYPSQSNGVHKVYLDFELQGNSTTALTVTAVGGGARWIAGVVRSGVGINVITFVDAWSRVNAKTADVDDTAADGSYATCGALTNEGSATPLTMTIRTYTSAGALQDLAVGRRISVSMAIRNGQFVGGD